VGPKPRFAGKLLMGRASITTFCGGGQRQIIGPWENGGKGVKDRYLGLKFKIKGKIHYGWARLNFPYAQGATMTGYAYETIANKPIVTGKTKGPDVITVQPASLGRLAQGSAGLAAWR
jgi:hypothetical protein